MGPFYGVLELLIFKIFWPLMSNRDTKLTLNPQRGPFNVKMLPPPLMSQTQQVCEEELLILNPKNSSFYTQKIFIK